jgi:phosphoglycerate dehydrogenase-like enzyme
MKILYTPYMTVPTLAESDRERILQAAGPGASLVDAQIPERQKAELADADVLFGRISPEVFAVQRRLRYYHFIGAGVDGVLSPELVSSEVVLVSDKGQVGPHLSEQAFALLLGISRQVHTAVRCPDYALREPLRRVVTELYEQTMGIVGFGGSGRDIATRALAFGMRVLAIDIEDVAAEPGVKAIWKPERLPDLLQASDVVMIALPLTRLTRGLFDRERFRQMRRHAILINVTRGAIVNGGDLLEALDQGVIGGAGLDVTDPEPLPQDHPLWRHPRALITPHIAGGSPRRAERIIDALCANLRRLRAAEPLAGVVDKVKGY